MSQMIVVGNKNELAFQILISALKNNDFNFYLKGEQVKLCVGKRVMASMYCCAGTYYVELYGCYWYTSGEPAIAVEKRTNKIYYTELICKNGEDFADMDDDEVRIVEATEQEIVGEDSEWVANELKRIWLGSTLMK